MVCRCCFADCLASQQQACACQGRISRDSFAYCHAEMEVADQTCYLIQSGCVDAGSASPRTDPLTLGAWLAGRYSYFFCVPCSMSGLHFGWDFILFFFSPTIEVVTFRHRGWCMLGIFLLLEFTRLGHGYQDLLSPCDSLIRKSLRRMDSEIECVCVCVCAFLMKTVYEYLIRCSLT